MRILNTCSLFYPKIPKWIGEKKLEYSREIEMPKETSGYDVAEKLFKRNLLTRISETTCASPGDYNGDYFEFYYEKGLTEIRSDSEAAVEGVCKIVNQVIKEPQKTV